MFTVNFKTDNAAFDPNPRVEITAILRELIKKIERGNDDEDSGSIRDSNGNNIGTWRLKYERVD